MDSPSQDSAQAVQRKQQLDAERLLQRLEELPVADVTVNYTLEQSSVIIPAVLIRFLVLAVLFRLNSAKKWHATLDKQLLPQPLRNWLGIERLADLARQATVDWIPPAVLLDTLCWEVTVCLTQCGMPQPVAVIRQTIRDLLFRDAETENGGIVVSGRFWRRFANRGSRRLPAGQLAECQERIDFVLGEVDLSEVVERRWQEIPELSQEERTRLEAVRVAEPCERLQALEEAFEQGLFDFVVQLLACSYSRYGRRPHHPLLLLKVWLAMLSVGTSSPAGFLRSVDDSLQLRLFLQVMSHHQLPSERRIKGFASERLAPVIDYLVLWHQFLLLELHETTNYRQWHLWAVAILRTHIHAIVGVPGDPESAKVLGDLKSYGSRALNRKWSKPASGTWWADAGSKRKLKDDDAVLCAVRYVVGQEYPLLIWTVPIPELGLAGGLLTC